jgi:EPS-associated MarR family transcriptional regulator
MNEHTFQKEEALDIIRELEENPFVNQRSLSEKLNMSLGKTNYMLKALAQKGFIKIANFTKVPQKNKRKAVKYLLTQDGIQQKIALTYHFLKLKEREYERLKSEYSKYAATINRQKTLGGEDA